MRKIDNVFELWELRCEICSRPENGEYKKDENWKSWIKKEAEVDPKIEYALGHMRSEEEFLTQIFTHIMLQDTSFRKAFLEKLVIVNCDWKFFAEYSYSIKFNKGGKPETGEMDVFGKAETEKSLLVIENKIDSEIECKQLLNYAKFCNNKKFSKYTKYIVALTKFSGLISSWNSLKNCNVKDEILKNFRAEIAKEYDDYHCRYIYWHEVYELLENNFSDTKIQQELLAFLKSQNLDQSWYQDIGCPYWRQEFIKEFNKFADLKGLKKKSVPDPLKKDGKPNIKKIDLPGDGNYFGGARIQGARRAADSKNYSLLQINVNGKVKDLSDYINDPAECIKQSEEMILEAFGKKQ